MNIHIFQGPEGQKGERGEPVRAIKKHKSNLILQFCKEFNISLAGHALCSDKSSDKLKSRSLHINIVFSAGAARTTGTYSSEFYCPYWVL